MRNVLQHSLKVTHDPSMTRVVSNVESDVELLPKSHRAPEPFARGGGVHEWGLCQTDVGSPAQGGLVKHLGDVLLGLCRPASQVRAQSSDEVVHDVEGPIVLLEARPLVRQLKSPPYRRETLKLLDSLRGLVTIQLHMKSTMRPPGDLPGSFKPESPLQRIGDQKEINLTAMQRGAAPSVHDVRLKLALDDRSSKGCRFILPISSDDKRCSQMVQEGHEVAEDERVAVRL